MIGRLLAIASTLLLCASCLAQDATQAPTSQSTTARSHEIEAGSGVVDVLKRKAQEIAGALAKVGKPRTVPKGAKPEIIVRYDGLITFNGKPLRFGDSIDTWRSILPSPAACEVVAERQSSRATVCNWHEIGIGATGSHESPNTAAQLLIYIRFRPDPWDEVDTNNKKSGPKQAFKGYLEIDGYGIDEDTKFWELRASADSRRDLRCGFTECSHPHGGGGGHTIHLWLDGKTERDRLLRISLGGVSSEPR